MNVDNLTDVVQDLEAVDKLAALLWVEEPWNHICGKLVLDSEVSLEVLIEELEELLLQLLCRSALGK